MRPIDEPRRLDQGTTLYHSAFGFARVAAVGDGSVELTWDRKGAHLPVRVSFDNLKRVYSMCGVNGFFHRALDNPAALRHALHERPAEALVWLLDDLAQPQRLRDVMDWLVGRELFTPKTFVRWWGTAESAVKADPRLSLEGEWLHLRAEAPRSLTQLEPHAVTPEAEFHPSDPVFDDDLDAPVTAETEILPFEPMRPVPLGEARPPASSLPAVGLAVAQALAGAHGQGRLVHPNGFSTVLSPDGSITFRPTEPPRASAAEPPSPGSDVRAAAIVLLEAFLGRSVPPLAKPADLLPHVRHRLPDLPPSALAPLVEALRPDPDHRPTAAAWAEQWEGVHDAEATRGDAFDASSLLTCGYDSHVGRVKLLLTQTNQDALWVGTRGPRGLYVLADGISISDAGRGEIASWLAVQSIARLWQVAPLDRVSERRLLDRALHLANRAICEHALRAADGDLTGRMPMGTTVTVALTLGNHVHLAWLGDSRAYLVGPWGVSQLTADDNVSGERFGAWCSGAARSWDADGHALVRYLGHFDARANPAPFPAHHASFVLHDDERLILCSDGITDYIEGHESEVAVLLRTLARRGDPHTASRALVDAANKMGGGDNASVIVLQVDGSGVEIW